jgi:peptidoglycan/LPS O-acetylase OafA/YrhL
MQIKTTLQYLDGYRGFLANTVIMAHIGQHVGFGGISSTIQPILNVASQHTGVVGFFVLSAFLLTYRLMIDFENSESLTVCFIRTAQYSVRRFFRIYLVFAIFWTLVHYGPSVFTGYNRISDFASYNDGLSLSSEIGAHLWTIPPEILYYFCIPILCFVSIKSGKYWIVLWLLSSLAMIYVDLFNPLAFALLSYPTHFKHNAGFKSTFTIFYAGSQLAIFFFYLEKAKIFRAYVNRSTIRNILYVVLNILFVSEFILLDYFNRNIPYTLVYQYSVPNSHYVHSFSVSFKVAIIFILLHVDNGTYITQMLNSYYLRMCGRYSFGIYLLHPMVIRVFKNIKENFMPVSFKNYIFYYAFTSVFITVVMTYLVGLVWFHVVENTLIKVASKLSKSIDLKRNKETVQIVHCVS